MTEEFCYWRVTRAVSSLVGAAGKMKHLELSHKENNNLYVSE